MAQNLLFPEDSASSTDAILLLLHLSTHSGTSKNSQNQGSVAVGDHINELLDRQLQKLISVKYENDPTLLIRQLSRDLAAKETELILLRRKSAQREHELSRLCTEFGNLSSLELDKRLAALQFDNDLHKALSGMIESAVDQPLVGNESKTEKPRKNTEGNPLKHKRKTRRANAALPSDPSTKDPLLTGPKAGITQNNKQEESNKTTSITSDNTRPSTSLSLNTRSSQWLQWLTTPSSNDSTDKSPVESRVRNGPLELNRLDHSAAKNEAIMETDTQTDRFGFYNNPTILRETKKPSKLEEELENSSKVLSLSQNSSSSSDISFTEITASTAQTISSQAPKQSTVRGRFSQSMEKLKRLGQQHDVVNQKFLSKWDSLMSNIERDNSKINTGAEDVHELFGFKASKLRWCEHGLLWFFSSTEGEGRSESRFYKELLGLVNEEGIPPRYRNVLWLELSGASNKSVPGEFQRLLSFCQESTDPVIKANVEQINLDLHRTLSSNKLFFNIEKSQPGPHFYKLQDILYAFVAYNLEVGYSQGMNRIVGNLILGISDGSGYGTIALGTEDIFWVFVALLEELLPKYKNLLFYHQRSLPLIQKDVSITAHYYLPKLLPQLHQHLMGHLVEIDIVILGWWLGLFTEAVNSLDLWFNVLDGLMLAEDPGVKLVTYSLAILKVFERNMMDLESADGIYNFFQKLKVGSVANIRIIDFVSTCYMIEKHVTLLELGDLRNKTA